MQTVCWWFPIPKRMLMCATSSNRWELAIVVGAGEWSVWGVTARSLFTCSWCTYVYSDGVLRDKLMKFGGVMHIYIYIYIYHILYEFGLFTFKSDCFIVVALKAMWKDLKPTYSRRHLPLLTMYNNKKPTALSSINIGRQCVPVHVTDRYIRSSRGSRKQITYCIIS